ncbi:Hypothetical protein PHPALM_4891 [Phytophthora palmivora]|uniref:Uncharacterized protein n=1 Tax=Phytophthora palmivora TaxID=4796 RepID=A0A2P4YIR2_9STRA|nr:Hypothetical protein PHPALM_4891 [Phytophthora palmivora]
MGACFPDQKSCTIAMHPYAVNHNMKFEGGGNAEVSVCRWRRLSLRSYNAKITGASTERLLY